MVGTQTGSPQQEPSTQRLPVGQSPLGHRVSPAQGVWPGTQKPPPLVVVVQMQSGFVGLHCSNEPHVLPWHLGFGLSVHRLSTQI